MRKAVKLSIMVLSFVVLGISAQAAQAETITFGTSERMYAPNCHCKADVSTYNLAPWCDAKTSCDGDTDTHSINLAPSDYEVTVNLGGLSDYQKYEVVVLSLNGKEYSIPDQGGNSTSTGTATYNLGKIYLSGTVTVRAYHKYANIFTGKWYADENSKIGSYGALESVYITSIVFNKMAEPKPTCAISANPTTINSGGTSTLSWSSANATSASINQNIGTVTTTGTRNVSPTSNTTYTMTVNGSGGTATCSATVNVNVLTPAIMIVKNDNDNGDDTQAVVKNGTATFKITVTNNGTAPLRDIIIYDEAAPNCGRTAAQTKGLYAGDLFDPKESFSYTCTDTNINEAYTNIAIVKATDPSKPGATDSLIDDDSSKVTVTEIPKPTPEPEPTPDPKPTPDPTPEPKKDKCEGEIGNYIWLDANNDGVQDKGEKGLSGISVKLKTDDGKVVDKETTNSKGEYEFDDLCAGDYTVYVDDEDVASYTQTYDPDGKNNNKTDVTLKGNKDSHTKADFGYNKGRTTPVTGSGSMALTFTGLISMIGFASYRQLKQRMSDNILA